MAKITTFDVEPFNRFDKIIVCGPQRSGTRFVTAAIAKAFRFWYHDDRDSKINAGDLLFYQTMARTQKNWVIHGPGFSSRIHESVFPDVLVVWMIRNPKDVIASEKRIGWKAGGKEELLLPPKYRKSRMDGELCERRQTFWRNVQRDKIPEFVEVEYESLDQHPLFIQKDRRSVFPWCEVGFEV